MKRVIETSEVLGIVDTPEEPRELSAVAEANYDEKTAKLSVLLDAFLRSTDLLSKEKRTHPQWLPKSETVHESVGPDERKPTL